MFDNKLFEMLIKEIKLPTSSMCISLFTTRIALLTNTGELSTCILEMLQRCDSCVVLVFE